MKNVKKEFDEFAKTHDFMSEDELDELQDSLFKQVNKELWKGYPEDFFDEEVDGSSWYQAIGDIISSMALDFAEQTNLPNDHLYDVKSVSSKDESGLQTLYCESNQFANRIAKFVV